ncbi:MAG TPA: protein kinase [Polyangiaceae bacterium]|nr:protein kinase [Polyangiaceae bacterium]
MTTALSPGDRIADKYRIVSTLGKGGMGVVYLAHHERLDRPVAIKLLHAQLEQKSVAVTRFEREIKAMALVNNRHIAHAVDADVLDDGSLFLVMEYLVGRNLRAELRARRAIPYAEAAAYVIQACHGIAALHELGMVHRDLKPANLFLTELSGARCIKVLDFGVVKFLESYDVGAATEADVAVGTPLYMSPEQLRTPEQVSPRSDVWALGVVLYELIAGLSPFAAATPGAVVAAVMLDAPVPLATLVPEVPEELARVVAGALSKVPKFRIGSVRELAELLSPFAMPTDAIRVAPSTSSPPPARTLSRTSVRPQLAAQINRNTPPDALRDLPSLAKIAIARGSDDKLTHRPSASLGAAEQFGPPTVTAARPLVPQPQLKPPLSRPRWGLRAAGSLFLFAGLLLGVPMLRSPASDAAVALQVPAHVALPATALARAVDVRMPPDAPRFVAPSAQHLAPASSSSTNAAPPTLKPTRLKPPTISARTPSPASGISTPPVAADGKPLHL